MKWDNPTQRQKKFVIGQDKVDMYFDFNEPKYKRFNKDCYVAHFTVGNWRPGDIVNFGIASWGEAIAKGQIISIEERLIGGHGPGTYIAAWIEPIEFYDIEDPNDPEWVKRYGDKNE